MSTEDPVDAVVEPVVDSSQAPLPETPPTEEQAKHALAAWLTELSSGQLKIKYQPGAFWNDESPRNDDGTGAPSQGHVWRIDREDSDDEDGAESVFMNFDDRDGPVPAMAVAQLRRVGNLYFRAAKELEQAVETGTPIPPCHGQTSLVLVRVAADWCPTGDRVECWEDVPEEGTFEPVAMVVRNLPYSSSCDREIEADEFNRMSWYHSGQGNTALWMMPMDSVKALALNLPTWDSVKGSIEYDYHEYDVIGWHGNYPDAWLDCALEAARSLDPEILIGGVPVSLYKECETWLGVQYDIAWMLYDDLPVDAIDFETGELVVTSKDRRWHRWQERNGEKMPEKRYKLAGKRGPEALAALRRLVESGDKRKTLFPEIGDTPRWHEAREAFSDRANALFRERSPADVGPEDQDLATV